MVIKSRPTFIVLQTTQMYFFKSLWKLWKVFNINILIFIEQSAFQNTREPWQLRTELNEISIKHEVSKWIPAKWDIWHLSLHSKHMQKEEDHATACRQKWISTIAQDPQNKQGPCIQATWGIPWQVNKIIKSAQSNYGHKIIYFTYM